MGKFRMQIHFFSDVIDIAVIVISNMSWISIIEHLSSFVFAVSTLK